MYIKFCPRALLALFFLSPEGGGELNIVLNSTSGKQARVEMRRSFDRHHSHQQDTELTPASGTDEESDPEEHLCGTHVSRSAHNNPN